MYEHHPDQEIVPWPSKELIIQPSVTFLRSWYIRGCRSRSEVRHTISSLPAVTSSPTKLRPAQFRRIVHLKYPCLSLHFCQPHTSIHYSQPSTPQTAEPSGTQLRLRSCSTTRPSRDPKHQHGLPPLRRTVRQEIMDRHGDCTRLCVRNQIYMRL